MKHTTKEESDEVPKESAGEGKENLHSITLSARKNGIRIERREKERGREIC